MAPLSNPVDELFATLIGKLEEDPGFDVQGFLRAHPAHATALKTRLERLRRVGLVGDARGESTLVAAMRERFGVHSEVPLPRSGSLARAERSVEELLPSRVIGGRYRVLAEIGRGGMGRVFRALDLDLGRDVALKVVDLEKLLPAADAAQRQAWIERFLTEAQVTAQLEHPSIVPVHDIGIDRAGELYYTMKLVEGETLEQKITQWHTALARGTPFPTPELVRIVIQVCQAVAFAHERGVMHRDLKPSNVMVGRFGEVQVMDWGLAKLLAAEPDTVRPSPTPRTTRPGSHTLAGEVLGTPTHMAPEQARGDPKAIGRAADVFGLGAILHHGLHGAPPNGMESGGTPDRERRLPAELEAICRKALHPAPEQRYAFARALAEDLQAFLEERVVRAYEAGALAELRKWMQRNRSTAAALVAIVLALFLGLVVMLLRKQSSRRGEDVLRLAALHDLASLVAEADELWPLLPAKRADFDSWIARAEELVEELPLHRADLERRTAEDARESRWWAEQLRSLVTGLEGLASGLLAPDSVVPGHGWSVPKRRAFMERLVTGFAPDGEFARLWDAALPAIRDAYPEIDLTPQLGLVPIGPDSVSGLWEFAHLQTGEPPRRDETGKLVLDEATGVVLVLLHGGEFLMGAQGRDSAAPAYDPQADSVEAPPHAVFLAPFFLSKYEVTQRSGSGSRGRTRATTRLAAGSPGTSICRWSIRSTR
jgi:serine/threonine protein kinase